MSNVLYTYYKQYGNKILLKYRKDGRSHTKSISSYKPSLYTKSEDDTCDAQSIFGYPLTRIDFDDINEAKDFVKRYKDVEGFKIEGNSDYGNQFIIDLYKGQMPNFNPKDIRIGILDIEVVAPEFPDPKESKWPISGITFYDSFTNKFYTYGDKPYTHDPSNEDVGHLNVEYILCEDEIDICRKMLTHFRDFKYDIISGWNSEFFDIPYIIRRCNLLFGEEYVTSMLSPFNKIKMKEIVDGYGKTQIKYEIYGLPHLDYMDVYKKHNHSPRENYKLDNIGFIECGVRKLSYEEEGDLNNLYKVNPQKYYAYNIRDVDIIKLIDIKRGLFNVTFTLAYYTLSNFEDTLGTVKIWEQLIAKHLYSKGKVPLFSRSGSSSSEKYDGAFVHPTVVGKHKWVVSFDLNSLYPMNEIQYNIGTETYIPRDQLPSELQQLKAKYTLEDLVDGKVDLSFVKELGYCMTGNFEFYRKDIVSFLSEIKDELYAKRKQHKKTMLSAKANYEALLKEAKKRGIAA